MHDIDISLFDSHCVQWLMCYARVGGYFWPTLRKLSRLSSTSVSWDWLRYDTRQNAENFQHNSKKSCCNISSIFYECPLCSTTNCTRCFFSVISRLVQSYSVTTCWKPVTKQQMKCQTCDAYLTWMCDVFHAWSSPWFARWETSLSDHWRPYFSQCWIFSMIPILTPSERAS